MPLYGVICEICGKEEDIFRPLSRFDDLPECCGQIVSRQLSAPTVIADIQPYQSMATGEWIMSRSQH
jgi:predicted nucleic acid-binding Zn ribbon protein